MGRLFLEHLGGTRLFSCTNCDVFLTNRSELVSTRFTGATGRAFLFNKVVNLDFGEVQDRIMLTGRHMVRDVSCKKCKVKLGWMYEFATDESQRYKEGRVILERALITESEGFPENVVKNQETDTSSASQTVYKECFRMIETVNGNTYFLFTVQTKTKSYTIDELDVTLIDGLDHWNCKIENEMLKSLASQSGLCLLDYAEVLLSALCDEITAEGNDDVKTAFLYDVAFGSQYCQLSWKQKLSNCTFYHLGTATLTKIGTAEVVSSLQRLYNFSFREITNLKETLHSLETTCERLKQERSQAFADLKQAVETKRYAENELIAKFEKILNEKKKRIRELEDKQLFNIQQSTDSQSDSASSIELFTSDQLAPFRPGTSTCATNFFEDKDKSDSNIQKTTP
ncbi:Protein yippee-like 5 [Trichinella britovi]|uniref:Protein yippee-like 5 n=1 Tax=Trichinella britovi TaxID=45882 RepID=A0A0V1CNE5_TRIBR|nr:Protein yippee-like 5 [Trichinella britovi]